MNHNLLKTVIFDQHDVIRSIKIIPRACQFEENANYVLTGIRRAGKSTMLYQRVMELVKSGVQWNQIIYINFEDERLTEFTLTDFQDIVSVQSELSNEQGYFFLDEIQNIDGWEKFARRMADSKEHVYITGSNAKMLSREIESTLGGRYLTRTITPFSFPEYLTAYGCAYGESDLAATKTNGKIRRYCTQYFKEGGFPEALLYTSSKEYLSSLYRKILLGDMIARNNIRNEYAVRLLMKKIAESVRSEVSFTKLHGMLKSVGVSVGKDTVIDYITYAEEAYLLFHIQNWFAKFAEREGNPKYYFSDNGILNLFLTDKDSALLENIVAITLQRHYQENVYYLKSPKTGIDIDFYIPEMRMAIQVAYSLSESAGERETDNLIRLAGLSDICDRFKIITMEEEGKIERNGVTIDVIPLYRFLLEIC